MYASQLKSYPSSRSKLVPPSCDECSIRKSSAFSELKLETLDYFCHKKNYNFYRKGQRIIVEGDAPHGIYLLQSGKAKVFKRGLLNQEQIVRLAGPGDVLTFRALGEVKGYAVSATALEDTTACIIARDVFRDEMSRNPSLTMRVMDLLAAELDRAENLIKDFAQKSVKQRVAQMLLFLRQKYGEAEKGLNIFLSRDELANLIGTATETLVRILSELKDKKIISTEGPKIFILNREQLERIVDPSLVLL